MLASQPQLDLSRRYIAVAVTDLQVEEGALAQEIRNEEDQSKQDENGNTDEAKPIELDENGNPKVELDENGNPKAPDAMATKDAAAAALGEDGEQEEVYGISPRLYNAHELQVMRLEEPGELSIIHGFFSCSSVRWRQQSR